MLKPLKKKTKEKFLKNRLHSELEYHREHSETIILTPPIPKIMMLDLCNGCNHTCIFCMNRSMTRKINKIKKETYLKIISEAKKLGVEELGLYTTGDPFMHKDLVYFIKKARTLGFKYVYLSTNGGLATPQRLKEVLDAGLDSIKFSVNAGSRDTYHLIHGSDDWQKILNHISFVSEYRTKNNLPTKIYISSIITKFTKHERSDIFNIFSDFVDEIYFVNCDAQQGHMFANEDKLYDKADLVSFCSLPFNRLHVTSEGYLTMCCVDYQNYLAVADLNKVGLKEAWNNSYFIEMRKRHMENKISGTLCGNCLSNQGHDIQPVCKDLASMIDFSDFYKNSKMDMENLIAKREDRISQ
jgi:MoaA/NifB/PqqE/SkfB family radical SAM enzyme